MSTSNFEDEESVLGRKLVFSPQLQALPIEELIDTCPGCQQFFLYCFWCSKRQDDDEVFEPCHRFRLVFTDGACRNNGQLGATAGIGVASGYGENCQRAIPITEMLDQGQRRTSQRAELLAAIAGLDHMAERNRINKLVRVERSEAFGLRAATKSWIIATDSEYVVKGMTEWLPSWKENNLRNSRGVKPANLDLFLRLDEALAVEEGGQDLKIGFWHVPRQHNTIADGLAKAAARLGAPTGNM